MIDPVIFTIRLFGREWPVYWYGVILMTGFIVGCWLVERELKRRGENGELIWDAAMWILIPGVIGARLWFVLNATLGGSTVYSSNPAEILNIRSGGLHIFGAFLFGAAALMLYLRKKNLDPWLFLDSAAPALLIGQAIGRLGNFVNQELYGPPTDLPWGIPISGDHRMPQFQDLAKFPVETARFHPTFAYEMLWNFAAAGFLLWLSRRYEKELKPGTLFAGWLVLAGIGRTWIELFFRPDQPKIGDSIISYSMIFSALMAIAGAIMLMARYRAIHFTGAENWAEEYKISTQPQPPAVENPEEIIEKDNGLRAKRSPSVKGKAAVGRTKPGQEPPAKKKTTNRTKKSV